MNQDQLTARIAGLRGQARRLIAMHGLSWLVAWLVPAIVFACVLDWVFQLDSIIRAALLTTLLALAIGLGWRLVLRPLLVRFANLDAAFLIEKRWPGLEDRLASTVQFSRITTDGGGLDGSRALREATISQALAETSVLDFREVIDRRPVRKAIALGACSLAFAGLLAVGAPRAARIAMARLLHPFGGPAWPKLTHLVLDSAHTTLKVARGDAFTLAVKVAPGDRIPSAAKASYRFADGEEAGEALRFVEGGEFRGRLESVNQPFHFSVVAGDDSESIRDVAVRVVPPPGVKSLAVRLVTPKYTGLGVQTLAPGLTQIRALEGTRIELEGTASKPLERVELALGEGATKTPATLDPAGLGFTAGFPLAANGAFWFDLLDREGFRNREADRFEVRVFPDEAPRVQIEEPRTDRDVPEGASIAIKATLDDDFGLHSSRLVYRIAGGDSEPRDEAAVPLWAPRQQTTEPGLGTPYVKHQEVQYLWPLAPLKATVGSVITFHVDARDFDTLKGPKTGKSREIRLRIVSKDDANRQFDDARRELREEISRLLNMQNQALDPVERGVKSLEEPKPASAKTRDDIKNAAMIQRQVSGRLANRDEGLAARLRRMLEDLTNFKLQNPDAQKQLEEMLGKVGQLRDERLSPAEQGLSRASKSLEAEPAAAPTKPAKDALAEARDNQRAIAGELKKMLDGLSEFETYRGVVKDAQELLKQQEQAMKQTADVAAKPDTVGKAPEELPAERKSEMAELASKQAQVGKGLGGLMERMAEMAKRLDESDPLAASGLRESAARADRQGTAGKIADAAGKIEKNQMGQAQKSQEQARDDLRELVDSIQNRRERELTRLVKELKNAEAELEKTRARQAQNLKKTRAARDIADPVKRKEELRKLAKEQAQIKKDLERQLQKLAKLNAGGAERAGRNAQGKMDQAQGELDDDQGDEAGKKEEEALADLDDAQDELEQTRKDAEEQLAVEQLARMGDQLKSLAERQAKVVTEIQDYERTQAAGKLSIAQRAGVRGLGQVQSGLRDETGEMIEKLEGAPVFALTLRRAAAKMEEAAKRLQEIKPDSAAQAAAQDASDRFKQLIESLKPDSGGQGQGQGGGGGGGGGGAGGQGGDGIPATAQLKMLKSLQQEINEKTESFDELKRRDKKLTPEQTREIKRLADDQGVLADLVRDLTRPRRDDGEE